MVERKTDCASMGMCGLIKRPQLNDIDIGFAFLPEFRGAGYGVESAEAVLNYAHTTLGFQRVAAVTSLDNVRSIQLVKKLGMHFERIIKWPDGEELKLFAVEF
jgi:RimJ/RimL family protein N-acetyltransferase